jgi:hypothetical protein
MSKESRTGEYNKSFYRVYIRFMCYYRIASARVNPGAVIDRPTFPFA